MATRTIVLHGGDSTILPVGTVIDQVIVDGSATVESSCGDLPAPTAMVCKKLKWEFESSESFYSIFLGNQEYGLGGVNNAQGLHDYINGNLSYLGIVSAHCWDTASGTVQQVYLKVPETLDIEIKVLNPTPTGDSYYYLHMGDENSSECTCT